MDSDLVFLVNTIKEKTGIEVVLSVDNGADFTVESVPFDVSNVYCDTKSNKTYFKTKYKSQRLNAYIIGASEAEKNYAFLIAELIENTLSKDSALSKDDLFRMILLGEANYSQTKKFMKKYFISPSSCFAMIIKAEKNGINEVLEVLNGYSEDTGDYGAVLDEKRCVFVKFIDETGGDYQSGTEYAEFLVNSVYEETGINISVNVGCTVKCFPDISASFLQASAAERMGDAISAKGAVHFYKEYIIVKMIEDLPKYKLREYLDMLLDANAREIFLDDEMTNTAEEFLENSLNVSETSRKLYLHRNTLNYRLDKIEKATGLNIRKFAEAVTFRLTSILVKILK